MNERAAAPPAQPGLFFGIASVFRGLGFLFMRPALWGHALVPVVIAGALIVLFGAAGVVAINALTSGLVQREGTSLVLAWLLRVVLWLVSVAAAFLVATALAQPLSGFALDALSTRQEEALGGPRREGPAFLPALLGSLKVTLLGLLVGLPTLLGLAALSFAVPPLAVVTVPLKVVVVGLLAAWDLLDYPLSLRAMSVRARLSFIAEHFGAVLGFGVSVALMLLVPGVGLFLLPVGVVAATRLVVATERVP